MLDSVQINNFKSWVMDKPMNLAPKLNLIIGLNGSGKTSLLQAVDFIVSMGMIDGIRQWMQRRHWIPTDLVCKIKGPGRIRISPFIDYALTFNEQTITWSGRFDIKSGRTLAERISVHEPEPHIFQLNQKKGQNSENLENETPPQVFDSEDFQYFGSFMSAWKPKGSDIFFQTIDKVHSLDLLAPNLIRSRTRFYSGRGVGTGGEQLSQFLHVLPDKDKEQINEIMRDFYPNFTTFKTKKVQGGSKSLFIDESFNNRFLNTSEAQQVCDGILRVLAIIAECYACAGGTLLIDELEDGLNPELLEKLVKYLLHEAPCQTIITTHNPIILSLLTDEQAKASVYFAYKNAAGLSNIVPFFELPTPQSLLSCYYPGEVMMQVNLEDMANEAQTL